MPPRGKNVTFMQHDLGVFDLQAPPTPSDLQGWETVTLTPCATPACLLWCASIAAAIRSRRPANPVKSIFAACSRTCCDKICLPKYIAGSALLLGLNVFPPRLRFLISSAKQSSIVDLLAPAFKGVSTMYRFPAM